MSLPSVNIKDNAQRPMVWIGPWYSNGHNNSRYEALLPRLTSVKPIYRYRSQTGLSMALYNRLDKYLLSRFWYPKQLSRLARLYQALFCTQLSQIAHFPGAVIVDCDDPVFTADYVKMLNQDNVIAVVTTTELLKQKLESLDLNKPCHVIPSGVYLSRFNSEKAAALRAKLGKQVNDIVVGFAAPRLYTSHDKQTQSNEGKLRSINFLANVMEQVWQNAPSIQLWLMGLPSRSVQAYANVHPQVHLLGYVNHLDVLNYYANFDIAVYPRPVDMEGRHSIKLVEFMAVGVPIVSTQVTESFHITESGAGIVVDNVEAFAEQILHLAVNKQLRYKLGCAGQQYAQQFDWDKLAGRYEQELSRYYLSNSIPHT